MAQCRLCDRSGWFLSVDDRGLCKNCSPGVAIEVTSRARVLVEYAKLVAESTKLDTRLGRCAVILEHANALKRFEDLGIPTLDTPPSEWMRKFEEVRELVLLESANAATETARSKAAVSPTAKTKVGLFSKALLAIQECRRKSQRPSELASLEAKVKSEIHRIQLDGYLAAAKKAEFKNQGKKALDQYYEALYLLRHDDVEDALQKDQIGFIEQRIVALGGKVG